MIVERMGAILREHRHVKDAGVDAIAQYEINDTILAGERDSRFGPFLRQQAQSLALALRPGSGDGAMGDMRKGTSDGFNHAPPCHHRSRVDANYFHRKG